MYSEIFNGDYKICIGANQAENDALIKKAPQVGTIRFPPPLP
jgi:hypothetical protein